MHFPNQVDEADLLKLMDEEEVAEFTKPIEETKPEVEYSVAAKPPVRKNGNHLSG